MKKQEEMCGREREDQGLVSCMTKVRVVNLYMGLVVYLALLRCLQLELLFVYVDGGSNHWICFCCQVTSVL